jgi:hypothetical protein
VVGRLRRFPDNRFIGRRDLMIVFDCDDETFFRELEASVRGLDLDVKNLLQAFAPDDLAEAANRGFRRAAAEGGP